MIPPVHRTPGGIRDYREEELKWVENAICMRSAGVSVDLLVAYVKLFEQGERTWLQEEIFFLKPAKMCKRS